MAGRGTDIKLSKGVAGTRRPVRPLDRAARQFRVDRQLYGRAARQGDPGRAQLFVSAEDDLFLRHASHIRKFWRKIGP